MTDTAIRPPVEERPNAIPLLPAQPRRMGPTTRFLVLRTLAVLAAVELFGTFLVIIGDVSARAAGLSMVFPGAGFLYSANPLLFVLTWVLMSLALVLWWGMSMHWGIPVVWVLSVAISGALAEGPKLFVDDVTTWDWAVPVAYVLAAACVGTLVWTFEARFRRKRSLVPELNEYLRTADVPVASTLLREPNDMDAELLQWAYELTLQPIDRFDGFEWGDQLHGGTVVRYQLNYLGWALAPYAVNYIPNALGTIELSMRNLVLKQLDLRVWRYWQLLNRIGNLDSNPDPLIRDNIMFSGFTGDQINLYEAATGSTRFDEPGSLTFVWEDGRTFAYDHHTWMDAVKKNFEDSRLGFFPCEPGWAFAACNTIGAQALLGHDALHGTSMWSDIEPRWRETLEREYLMPDGNYANIRSTHTGLSWDTGETPGGEYFTTGSHSFKDVARDLHDRGRALSLRGLPQKLAGLRAAIVDDVLTLQLPEEWERNRSRKSATPGWTKLVGGARAVGDDVLAEAAIRGHDLQCATGSKWPERPLGTGVGNLALMMLVRWSTPMDNATINLRGYAAPLGPVVESAPWPEVMITLARSSDGSSLDLAVRPGAAPSSSPVSFGFAALTPSASYRLSGDGVDIEVVAGADGTASVDLLVDRALRLQLVPQ